MASTGLKWSPATAVQSNKMNASLHAKAKIVERETGVSLSLSQGSPAGSSKSGGTHLGPGDAADFEVVWQKGWTTELYTKKCLEVSFWFRTLGCVSYVRGLDADFNGRKDDSFSAHIHVIDREGDGKVWQAKDQFAKYDRGENGLVSRRRDVEVRPSTTYTLAQWLLEEGRRTQEDIMDEKTALRIAELAAQRTLGTSVTANGKTASLVQHMAEGFVDDRAQSKALAELKGDLAVTRDYVARVVRKVGA